MKTRLLFALCGLTVVAVALTAPAQAELMLINYDIGGTVPTGAGIIGAAGDVWNSRNAAGTGWKHVNNWNVADLLDSTGASSGASLSLSQPTGWKGNNGDQVTAVNADGSSQWNKNNWPTNHRFPFDRSLGDGAGGRILLTLSGLDDSLPWDVYVLWAFPVDGPTDPNAAGASRVSIDTSPTDPSTDWGKTLLFSGRSTDPVEGQDYVVFNNVKATGGVIEILTRPGDSNRGISGFQIQQVPEPGTCLLLLSALACGLLVRRRR